jgi:NADH:ubiquinone oxidoreductase subunit F (NADH-binding)
VGVRLLRRKLEDILAGKGETGDLEYLESLGRTIKTTSRCGLGQTAANPVLTTLKNFRPADEALIQAPVDGRRRTFDVKAALVPAEAIAGRESAILHD